MTTTQHDVDLLKRQQEPEQENARLRAVAGTEAPKLIVTEGE